MLDPIAEVVRDMEHNYQEGDTDISEYVTFNLEDTINKIEAYLNSKHTSGETDSQGREKPFFNIVTAAANIWYRATDLDRKNIRIKPTRQEHYMLAFVATIHLKEWMRRASFGIFLNEWGRVLARYGSAVSKFVEKDGELVAEVVPWNTIICDSIDFDNNIKIEKFYLTPAQLRERKNYDKEVVEQLIDNAQTIRKTLGDETKDNKSDFIEVYEVHGEMPVAYLTDNEDDEDKYQQQMHVISYFALDEKGEYNDYSLYSGAETKDPYMITHLIREDGRTLAIGAVENLFETQWMMNHNAKMIKDQLDLASKLVFQTSDGNFVGRNVLSSIENGDILIHAMNQPLTMVNNASHDIQALQSFGAQWQSLGNQINGISEAMLGQNAPSGSPWRQTKALLQESHSLFEVMTENKGLQLEQMMIKYVMPHLLKKMNTTDELSATLEKYQIKQIDSRFVPQEAVRLQKEIIKNQALNALEPEEPDLGELEQQIQEAQNAFGNQRFIKPSEVKNTTWKEVFKDLKWEFEYEITNEQTDKQSIFETLNTTLQVIANPAFAQNPQAQLIVDKILNETGVISPMELSMETPAAPPVGGSGVGPSPQLPTAPIPQQ